jgi:hypothetical protein
MGVTQGVHVGPTLVDPGAYLISSAGGPVAGDQDIDVARHALGAAVFGEIVAVLSVEDEALATAIDRHP